MTNLPATNGAYEKNVPEMTSSLEDALHPDGAATVSSFAGVVLIAWFFGKNLKHLHRNENEDHPDDINGAFWKRHRELDGFLDSMRMFLPEHLTIPIGAKCVNVMFLNLNLQAATICLHQAAILKAERYHIGSDLISKSTQRCIVAAGEIVEIMKATRDIKVGNVSNLCMQT